MQCPRQSPDLNPCISFADDKTQGKMPKEQAGTKDSYCRVLAEHHQGWNPVHGDWRLCVPELAAKNLQPSIQK